MGGGICVLMADFVSRGLWGMSCEVAGWRWVMCVRACACMSVFATGSVWPCDENYGIDVDQRCRGLKSGLVNLVGGSVGGWKDE